MRFVLVGLAGAAGALCRYGVGLAVGEKAFPWSTLAINIVGSFLLGLMVTIAMARNWPADLTAPITVGFIGSFTTFSTFSWETLSLGRADRVLTAVAYVALSIGAGLVAAGLGLRVGQLVQAASN